MILLIDNYDSFSYNLYQYLGTLDGDVRVLRNDEMDAEGLFGLRPSHIVLSPGPGYPKDAGVCVRLAAEAGGRGVPLLGVCLGHQAVCEAFGMTIGRAERLMHGKQSEIGLDNSCALFKKLPPRIRAGRYHSLAALRGSLPACLKITAETDGGEIMAVEHREYPVYGVQFHPESILTPDGMSIIRNFLETGGERP
jgi:anthranilate synthase component 2